MLRFLIVLYFFMINTYALELKDSKQYSDFKMLYISENMQDWSEIDNNFALGYTFQKYWFKIELKNSSNKEREFFLEFNEPFAQVCNFYIFEKSKFTEKLNGISTPIESRDIKIPPPVAKLNFKPFENKTIYIEYSSRFASFGFFAIYKDGYFQKKELFQHLFYFFYFGAVSIIILYNLFLYFSLKDSSYIYYVLFVLSFSFWGFLYSGYSLYFMQEKIYYFLHFSTPLAFVFFTLFTKKVLEIDSFSIKLSRVFNLISLSLSLSTIAIVVNLEIGYFISNLLGVIIFPIYLIASIYAIKVGIKSAKFYLISLSIFLISMMIISNSAMGILPIGVFNKYLIFIGSIIEVTLFSLLLAYRINRLKEEKFNIQKKLFKIQKNYSKELEIEVLQKTDDYKRVTDEKAMLLREVYHRVKNNLQLIISLLYLQSRKSESNEVRRLVKDSTNRVKSIALVHELLYSSEDLSNISSFEYFLKLTKSLITKDIEIKLNIDDIKVDMDSAIYLGIITSELITNSIKYAFEKIEKPLIRFDFKIKDSRVFLFIEDNGVGFDSKILENSNGLGIKLIKQISSKFKESNLELTTKRGVKFILEYKL